jgi:uncharacterized protein YjeT (DUF2065 family)
VTDFHSIKAAKDFLANRIAAEAAQQNIPLSEVERKMLYFSETDWTLPDMSAVSAEFDRDYNQDEYEQKIARLIANITTNHHHHDEAEEEKWDAAVAKLSESDHYILVLISEAGRIGNGSSGSLGVKIRSLLDGQPIRKPQDFLMALALALVFIVAGFALIALKDHFFPDGIWQTLGSHIDQRALPFLFVLALAGYFLFPRLWQFIRARSNRP